MAHHDSRTPRLGPRPGTQTDERMDMRNNVIYNWGGNGCYGGEGMNVNIVNNYYKPGPATEKRNATIQRRIASIGIRTSSYTKHDETTPNQWDKMWHVWGKFYVNGNVNSKYSDVTNDNWTYGMYNQITNGSGVDYTYTQETKDTMRIYTPITFEQVTTHSAEQAYEKVLSYAGACLHRDALDEIIINDTRNGIATFTGSGNNGGIINTQEDVASGITGDESPWPTLLNNTTAPVDTDGDGMPDEWETANNLNPNDASDGNLVKEDGYTNLEHYLNSIVADIMEAENEGGEVLSGQATGIEYIRETTTPTSNNNNLYAISGILIKTCATINDIENLPKGIYIFNNKKIVKL
ncbi:MAG: pectate lyase, partial [Prevotella sp.]|nr:pectate lyase [Prevotella sp.]